MTAKNKPSSPSEKLKTLNPSVDWDTRQNTIVRRLLNVLERLSLALEAPLTRLIPDSRFNPLYHTGTITVVLLFIILITGVYLMMFYQILQLVHASRTSAACSLQILIAPQFWRHTSTYCSTSTRKCDSSAQSG